MLRMIREVEPPKPSTRLSSSQRVAVDRGQPASWSPIDSPEPFAAISIGS